MMAILGAGGCSSAGGSTDGAQTSQDDSEALITADSGSGLRERHPEGARRFGAISRRQQRDRGRLRTRSCSAPRRAGSKTNARWTDDGTARVSF